MKKKFSFRALLSLYITLSFLVMTVSGIILYLAPPGRVANWSNWRLLGLLKSQWQAVHTIFTFIFIFAIAFHLFFNWKPLMAYLKTKVQSVIQPRKELFAATVMAVAVFILTINGTVPFSTVMNFGEEIKDSWSNETSEPPIPHAEEQSLVKFAETLKIEPALLITKLNNKGIKIESDTATIADIAINNNISPSEIFKAVNQSSNHTYGASQQGRGYGRKTIEQIFSELNLSMEEGIARLKSKGIEAEPGEKLKEVASRYNVTPVDIANAISGDAQ